MERAIQFFAAVNFLVIGLSHIFQRDVWVEFFAKLHSLRRLGPFAEGFLYLNFGSLLVSFHNVWSDRFLVELKKARLSAGITKVEAAELLGRPQSFISNCESGERRVDVVEFLAFCELYGADSKAILDSISPVGHRQSRKPSRKL